MESFPLEVIFMTLCCPGNNNANIELSMPSNLNGYSRLSATLIKSLINYLINALMGTALSLSFCCVS